MKRGYGRRCKFICQLGQEAGWVALGQATLLSPTENHNAQTVPEMVVCKRIMIHQDSFLPLRRDNYQSPLFPSSPVNTKDWWSTWEAVTVELSASKSGRRLTCTCSIASKQFSFPFPGRGRWGWQDTCRRRHRLRCFQQSHCRDSSCNNSMF